MSAQLPLSFSHPSTSSPAVSPARTSAAPDEVPGSTELVPAFGGSTAGPSPRSGRRSRSSKTSHPGKQGGCALCGGACTSSDIERPRLASRRGTSERRTSESASSSSPSGRGSRSSAPPISHLANAAGSPSASSTDGTTSNANAPAPTPTITSSAPSHGGTWPTLCASSCKGTGPIGSKSHEARLDRFYLDAVIQEAEGIQRSEGISVNPAWAEALMGFPPGWTEIQSSLFDGPPAAESLSTPESRPASPPVSPSKTSA